VFGATMELTAHNWTLQRIAAAGSSKNIGW